MGQMLRSILALSLLTGAACASHSAAGTGSGPARWSGNLRQPQMASSPTMGSVPAARAASYGSITITPVENAAGRMKIALSLNASMPAGTQLAWAVFSGACSAPTPPVAPAQEFPVIEIANSGSGTVRTEMSLNMEPRGAYHVNIYSGSRATDVSNVMMCANLTYEGAR